MKGAIRGLTSLLVLMAAALGSELPGLAPVASAADFAVTSGADEVDADTNDGVCLTANGNCTLRAAIQQANASAGADTVVLPAGTYTLTRAGGGDENGDLDIKSDLTIAGEGSGASVINGGALERVFEVHAGASADFIGVTITNGLGGLLMTNAFVTITNSTITGNAGGLGGGIEANGFQLTISNSTISNNTASLDGGGLHVQNTGLSISNTTISGNTGGITGGGIYLAFDANATRTLTNVTISGNAANDGAGVYAGSAFTAQSVTITGNAAASSGDGISGAASLFQTIIAANGSENCFSPGNNIVSSGFNLDDDGTCGLSQPTDLAVADALLGPLAGNGGPTLTHALLPGSPAIDAGPSNAAQCPGADQRGVARPLDGDGDTNAICDIGAFEAEYVPPPAPTSTPPSEPMPPDDQPTASAGDDKATPTPTAELGAGDADDDGGGAPGWLIGLLIGLGVAAAGAAGYWAFVLVRRRRRQADEEAPSQNG